MRAGVKEWQAVQYVVSPMTSWFQGKDETHQYTSVKADRQGLNRLLLAPSNLENAT